MTNFLRLQSSHGGQSTKAHERTKTKIPRKLGKIRTGQSRNEKHHGTLSPYKKGVKNFFCVIRTYSTTFTVDRPWIVILNYYSKKGHTTNTRRTSTRAIFLFCVDKLENAMLQQQHKIRQKKLAVLNGSEDYRVDCGPIQPHLEKQFQSTD